MADQQGTDAGSTSADPQADSTNGTTPPAQTDFAPITSQDDLNRIIAQRVSRAKPSDYDDLKAKAAKFDEQEQANMSALEKANRRIAELEKDNGSLSTSRLRSQIQARFKLEDEDAELFLTGSDEETLVKQAERLAARNATSDGKTPTPAKRLQLSHSGRAGDNDDPAADRERQAREFFGLD